MSPKIAAADIKFPLACHFALVLMPCYHPLGMQKTLISLPISLDLLMAL